MIAVLPPPRPRPGRPPAALGTLLGVVAAILTFTACAPTDHARPGSEPAGNGASSTVGSSDRAPSLPQPSHPGQTTATSAVVAPLGTVPYNGLTLPLTSPDGRLAALVEAMNGGTE